jgi:hypothetical protein
MPLAALRAPLLRSTITITATIASTTTTAATATLRLWLTAATTAIPRTGQ